MGKPVTLHRDDPEKKPLVGHVKVTREDWLNVARDILVSDGVGEVKVLPIADRLNVSRSSFYWYFKSRKALLNALLDDWEASNTQIIIDLCSKDAPTITQALLNFFTCFIDGSFDDGLDFAVREWSRRDGSVRARLDAADRARVDAVIAMYLRFDYDPTDADTRARILYYMQLGYHALDVSESMEVRMKRLPGYLKGFTGVDPLPGEVDAFAKMAMQQMQ